MKRKKLKGIIAVAIALTLSVTSLIGCGNQGSGASTDENVTSESILDSVISVETALTNAKLEGEKADVTGTMLSTMVSFTPGAAAHGNPLVNGGPDWSMQPLIYDYLCDYSSQPEKT
ncbi:hypothetical protein H9X77_01320, partial [Clostridium saudiense]|nr:hypothetical protein [Clostridium saudiense]